MYYKFLLRSTSVGMLTAFLAGSIYTEGVQLDRIIEYIDTHNKKAIIYSRRDMLYFEAKSSSPDLMYMEKIKGELRTMQGVDEDVYIED